RRLAACARAAWGASSVRRGSTPSAKRSTCTWTSCRSGNRTGFLIEIAPASFRADSSSAHKQPRDRQRSPPGQRRGPSEEDAASSRVRVFLPRVGGVFLHFFVPVLSIARAVS